MGDVLDLGDKLLDLLVRLLFVFGVHGLKIHCTVQLLHSLDLEGNSRLMHEGRFKAAVFT